MKKDPTLKTQATAIFIGNIAGTFLQFLIPAVMVRLISQEDFGVYRQFGLVAGTFVLLLNMGYKSSLFYFFPTTDFVGRQKIIQQTEFLFIVNLLIFYVIFYFFGDSILIYLNFKEFIEVKFFLALFVTLTLLSFFLETVFILEKNLRWNKFFLPITKFVRFIVLTLVILAVPGFKGPIYALALFAVFKFSYFVYYMFPYFKKLYKINFKLLKKQLVYSLPFGFALTINLVSTTFDKFFINKYITAEEFAIYSISFLSIPILGQFFKSIHNVVVPEIAIAMTNNNIKTATNLWKKTVEKTSSVTIPAVFLFWVMANEIITILYTIQYVEAVQYYRIFVVMFLISMFSHEIVLRGANKTKYIMYSNIIGAIVTITIGLIIIPKYQLFGAVITALIGRVIPMMISLNFERRIMKLHVYNWVNWKKIFTNILITSMIAIPIFFLKDYITNLYLRTFIAGSLFVILLVPLQIRFNLFIFKEQLFQVLKFIKLAK